MTKDNGNWEDNGNWDVDGDSFLDHAREDLEKAREQLKKYGPHYPPFTIGHEELKRLQEPRDYMGEYYPRPGDSVFTRFKKWRKRRQMKRMWRNVKIRDVRDGGVFGRYEDD